MNTERRDDMVANVKILVIAARRLGLGRARQGADSDAFRELSKLLG